MRGMPMLSDGISTPDLRWHCTWNLRIPFLVHTLHPVSDEDGTVATATAYPEHASALARPAVRALGRCGTRQCDGYRDRCVRPVPGRTTIRRFSGARKRPGTEDFLL